MRPSLFGALLVLPSAQCLVPAAGASAHAVSPAVSLRPLAAAALLRRHGAAHCSADESEEARELRRRDDRARRSEEEGGSSLVDLDMAMLKVCAPSAVPPPYVRASVRSPIQTRVHTRVHYIYIYIYIYIHIYTVLHSLPSPFLCALTSAAHPPHPLGCPQERVELIETKETQLVEIRSMLLAMQAATGVTFVDDADNVTAAAYVFVALNVAVALYLLQSVIVAPLLLSVGGVGGGPSAAGSPYW